MHQKERGLQKFVMNPEKFQKISTELLYANRVIIMG